MKWLLRNLTAIVLSMLAVTLLKFLSIFMHSDFASIGMSCIFTMYFLHTLDKKSHN